ncbi:penicillin acylase family protein [Nocardioides sp.]|uniref:penicillin acylase family protein n=1 Tax=Nocardioides sp. TaxID=35761 RepID=UPI0031FE5BA9|nr:sle [Nocardioides sp.]
MARILRDAYGVPHVRATSISDLAHGQGRATAHDRTWQLELQRRRATGTTAEVFGTAALSWDRLARRTRIADTARRAHSALAEETRSFVSAYVDGVNAGLRTDVDELEQLGFEAQPWETWTPLAVFLAQHLLFASLPGKLWEHRARGVLGEGLSLLSHEGPHSSGSNAWAVGGGRTASGFPLIGGDPHRVIESPGVYQQVRLACPEFDVAGFAFPGVPGVQHFAHAGEVAWAITNAMGDYQDVYAEQLRRVGGAVEALGPEGWERCESDLEILDVRDAEPERVEVIATARGLVFEGGPDEGEGLSVRAASVVLGDLGFDALLPLLRARTVDEVDAALDHWVEPVNNVVIADRHGSVRYRVAGRIPVRPDANRHGIVDATDPETRWTGWLDSLPRTDVPPDGHVVTANERRGPESDAIGTSFAPRHRADRLRALLAGRDDLTTADFAAFHNDALAPAAMAIRECVRGLEPGTAGAAVRDSILTWDGVMERDSPGAAAYAAWRTALVRRIAAEPVFAPLTVPAHDPVFAVWLDPVGRISLGLESLLAAGTPYGIDLRAHARAALDDAVGHPDTWGDTHVFRPIHAFELHGLEPPGLPVLSVSGDSDCVRCTSSYPAQDDTCFRGSVARYVWDLADRDLSGWVVPVGASGDPRDAHHHDQLPLWVEGELAPVVGDWDLLT